jgi:hypothetical protein
MGTGKFYGTPREHTACVHRIPRSGKTWPVRSDAFYGR